MDRWYVKVQRQTDGRISIGKVRHIDLRCKQLLSIRSELTEVNGDILEHIPVCQLCGKATTVHKVNRMDFIQFVRLFLQRHTDGSAILHVPRRMVILFDRVYLEEIEHGKGTVGKD